MWIRTDHEQNAKDWLRRDYRALDQAAGSVRRQDIAAPADVVDMAGRIAYGE
jgi:hypothetical protein